MKLILALLMLFYVSSANAQSFPGKMPPNTVVCNNSSSVSANPANCQYINLLTNNTSYWTNESPPALLSRLGGRLLVGDAVKNPSITTLHPCSTSLGDWFSNWQATNSTGPCTYFPFFQMVVESQSNSGVGTGAILAAGQTASCTGNCGAYGLAAFGLNNTASGHTGQVWGIYVECNQIVTFSRGGCANIESDSSNFVGDPGGIIDPFAGPVQVNLSLACGGGYASTFKCDNALIIVPNTKTFNTGIVFFDGSVTSGAGPTLDTQAATLAINMPALYNISWYTSAGTLKTSIWGGTAGKLNIFTSDQGLNIDGNAAVSCAAGTINPATVEIVHGIATHC